jgi:hypothetical protein
VYLDQTIFDKRKDSMTNIYVQRFLRFIDKTWFVPYDVNAEGKVFSNSNETVRNVGTICTVLECNKIEPTLGSFTLNRYIQEYNNAFAAKSNKTTNVENLQALSFLFRQNLFSYLKTSLYPKAREICKTMQTQVFFMETEFEQKEVLIALSNCLDYKDLPSLVLYVMRYPNTIFGWNWQAQFLRHYKQQLLKKNPKIFLLMKIDLALSKCQEKLLAYASEMGNKTETNQVAVCYEGLMASGISSTTNKAMYCWKLLLTRYNKKLGLFGFLDGTYRVDITCHVMNALLYAMENEKLK